MVSYIKRKSRKQEIRTAKEFSGRTQIASGAIDGLKGDVRTGTTSIGFNEEDFLIENKFTDARKYTLSLKVWEKIHQEAVRDNLRTPILQVDIYNLVSLVITDYNDFCGMNGFNYWTNITSTRLVEKAKSTRLDALEYQSMIEEHPYFCQLIHFKNSGVKLVVVNKDDFVRFLSW